MPTMRRPIDEFVRQTDCELYVGESSEDTRRIVRAAIDQGVERLVVAGGDGTVSQVVNALAPDFSAVELAVLPLGTGNDFARSLGIFDFEQACLAAVSDRVEPIDIVQMTSRSTQYFINSANGGFGGQVASDVQSADKERWGAFAYWLTAINASIPLDQYVVDLEMDNQPQSATVYGLTVANGRYVGGGFAIAPDSRLNDGQLNITMIPALSALELIAAGASFAAGATSDKGVRSLRAQKLRLRSEPAMSISVDGEPMIIQEATFEVIPRVLRTVVTSGAELVTQQ